jgi:hypothetical protein
MKTYILTVLLFNSASTGTVDYAVTASNFDKAHQLVQADVNARYDSLEDYLIVDVTEEESLEMALLGAGDVTLCEQVKKPHTYRINGKFATAYDYQAHELALLLETSNKIMTSKAKGFSYFLTIAHKMLKSDTHYAYVVKGLSNILDTMLSSKVSTVRLDNLLDCYLAIYRLAPRYVWDLVMVA